MSAKLGGKWERDGKAATARDLAESAALARQHRRAAAKAEHEARQSDAHARRVGASVRRAAREQQARYLGWFTVQPKHESGRSRGQTRDRQLETMGALTFATASHRGADGLSSFHFSWRGRGLRPRKGQKNSHPYRRGEAVRLIKYILRDSAREIEGGGIVSSIGSDPDQIASVFGAVEELEMAAGQDNANVYISIVISLPHELDAGGRERALTQIANTFEEERLPYAAVLHRPDPGRDQRNFHAHVVLSLRPFRKEKDGRYSFAALPSADLNEEVWIKPLRERISMALNEQMAQLQVETGAPQRCFTHLSYAERGLPTKTKADGKHGPGRKAAARRAQEAELAKAEADLRRSRLCVLDELATLVTGIVAHAPKNVAARVAAAREAVSVQARSRAIAARNEQLRAYVRRLARTSRFVSPPAGSPLGATSGRPTSFARAPFLSSIPFLSQTPTLREQGHESGIVLPNSNAQGQPVQVQQHEDEIAWALVNLPRLGLLPIRRQVEGKGGKERSRFVLVPRRAAPGDAAIINRAALVAQDARVQALLATQWATFLGAALAALTSGRASRPHGKITEIFRDDPRLRAAAWAADRDPEFGAMLDKARAVWNERETAGPPVKGTSQLPPTDSEQAMTRTMMAPEQDNLSDLAHDPIAFLSRSKSRSGR